MEIVKVAKIVKKNWGKTSVIGEIEKNQVKNNDIFLKKGKKNCKKTGKKPV